MTTPGNDVETAELPANGVWRIGPATDPYELRPPLGPDELNNPRAGNRFDSPLGDYNVLYFGTTLQTCFGETLARFRPDPALVASLRAEWSRSGFMRPGEIPADWRHRRLAVRVSAADGTQFLDIEAAATRAALARGPLAGVLGGLGVPDLDVAAIRGGDRRLTRAISYWARLQVYDDGAALYGGIRYLSRLNTEWECWALFDRLPTTELERRSITREMPELREIARLWGLTVF